MLTESLSQKIETNPFYRDRSLTITIINLDILRDSLAETGEDTLISRFLLAEEIRRFHSYTYPKRQIEWLGGRLAAKDAARRLFSQKAGDSTLTTGLLDWQVYTDKNGRPHIGRAAETDGSRSPDISIGRRLPDISIGRRLPDISISHSRNLAAALAVDSGRCGLDIQQLTGTVIKVEKKFVHPDDAAILDDSAGPLASLTRDARLTLLWAAKETIRKASAASPLPGFLELRLTEAAPVEKKTPEIQYFFRFKMDKNKTGKGFRVATGLKGDFALAITVVD